MINRFQLLHLHVSITIGKELLFTPT